TSSIAPELKILLKQKVLFNIEGFYLPYDYPIWVERRLGGNALANKKMIKAKKMAKILTYFPYVRSVMVSGSLSKGFMDRTSDIDFFVIMQPGSIAISKFLMGLFRRFFAPKSFCINFLIDSDNLHIKKQDLYTAIEMATLIPLIDDELYDKFMRVNMHWIHKFLPNVSLPKKQFSPFKQPGFQRILEVLCSSALGKKLDHKLRQQYRKRLAKNAARESHETGEVVIQKGIIKLHGKPYQKKIMNLYNKYQKDFFVERELVFNENFYD
ncbi:MAG: nucleotidyltransferase domain-containing protein, partial [Flavobacteriaceae bacterium]